MQQIFIEPDNIVDGKIIITGDDVNHLKNVLRMKSGERIRVSTSNGDNYFCIIEQLDEIGRASCRERV